MEGAAGKNNANILSSNELILKRCPLHQSLPGAHGNKLTSPTAQDAFISEKLVKVQYEERKSILEEERVERMNMLAFGNWIDPENAVLVTKQRHTIHWPKMGFRKDKEHYLYAEEALFLVEAGRMEVKNDGVAMSIQELYSVMFKNDLALEKYQVYSHLSRLGYLVLLHRPGKLTEYEKQLGLHKYPCSSKRKTSDDDDSDEQTPPAKIKSIECPSTVSDGAIGSCYGASEETKFLCVIPRTATNWSTKIPFVPRDRNNSENQPKTSGSCLRLLIPNLHFICDMAYSSQWRQISIPHEQFLPKNVGNRRTYDFDLMNMVRYKRAVRTDYMKISSHVNKDNRCRDTDFEESLEWRIRQTGHYPYKLISYYNYNDIYVRRNAAIPQQINSCTPHGYEKPHLKYYTGSNTLTFNGASKYSKNFVNWAEFKNYRAHANDMEILANGPLSPLWGQSAKPLLRPQECKTRDAVLQQLARTKQVEKFASEKNADSEPKDLLPVHFDVYRSDCDFFRKVTPVPDHRIIVTKTLEPVPDIRVVTKTSESLGDDLPLHFAIVDDGSVKFFSFTGANIPRLTV